MPFSVLIAGAGPAGLETALALREIAGGRAAITLLAPDDEFVYAASSVTEPFAKGLTRRYSLDGIAADLGIHRVVDGLASVDGERRCVATTAGMELSYDALVVATGAGAEPVLEHASVFWGPADAEAIHGLVQDVEDGYCTSVAFVVPPGTTWPLPLYELALLTAGRAFDSNLEPQLHLVTTEPRPLGMFGTRPSESVARLLTNLGVTVRTGIDAATPAKGCVALRPTGAELRVQRVVALPRIVPRRIPGLPAAANGFVPVDAYGRVQGADGVYAVGDLTDRPTKQGGLATQQADAAAQAIAAAAGADLTPAPFTPVLRAVLLTDNGAIWMERDEGPGKVARHALWWPPTKIAGRWLAPYLAQRDVATERSAPGDGVPLEVDLDYREKTRMAG
jgi:sulfide:quinone oxidoreductase